ncbi:Fic family protein [Candidatus Woesearchaeota archaeon]|nr:Fic family protein [Candidatus Woesearchaeota archaeon]
MVNHLIDIGLLKELDIKRQFIKENKIDPDEIEQKLILDEAHKHSARIEEPQGVMYDPAIDKKTKLLKIRAFLDCEDSLESAWDYGILNIKLPLKEEDIKRIAFLLDTSFFEQRYGEDIEMVRLQLAPYRGVTEGVRPSGAFYTPPYPSKVPSEMKQFINDMTDMVLLLKDKELHPAELAAYSHFNLARIHPFSDTNGRTARILQDLILRRYSFPAAAVFEGERRFYYRLLEDANKGYHGRDTSIFLGVSDEEKRFFNFIGSKVNTSLDKILDKYYASVMG